MTKVIMCDPPSGWKYGFPKPMPEEFHNKDIRFSISEWLVKEGYPQYEIDAVGDHFNCRYWETNNE